MASETMRRLDEIVGSFREGVIVRVSCGGMLCGECIQCTARAAKASLQREQRAAQDEIARLARELEEARSHARRVVVALRAICDEASICGPPLERRREEWEAALSEADEVLGELEVLYGAR